MKKRYFSLIALSISLVGLVAIGFSSFISTNDITKSSNELVVNTSDVNKVILSNAEEDEIFQMNKFGIYHKENDTFDYKGSIVSNYVVNFDEAKKSNLIKDNTLLLSYKISYTSSFDFFDTNIISSLFMTVENESKYKNFEISTFILESNNVKKYDFKIDLLNGIKNIKFKYKIDLSNLVSTDFESDIFTTAQGAAFTYQLEAKMQ